MKKSPLIHNYLNFHKGRLAIAEVLTFPYWDTQLLPYITKLITSLDHFWCTINEKKSYKNRVFWK